MKDGCARKVACSGADLAGGNVKGLLVIFVFLGTIATCRAAVPIDTNVLKKAVVFIYPARADGDVDSDHPLGTGFLVGVPKKDTSHFYLFFVTARHIVDPTWAFCPPNPNKVFLRFNKTGYDPEKDATGVEYLALDLIADAHPLNGVEHLPPGFTANGQPTYKLSDDDLVDAAVVQLDLQRVPQSKYDYLAILLADFATPAEIKALAIGDSITSAGLIPGTSGLRRNYPFFKFGNISNIPDEPVWTGCRGKPALRLERVWFIAANLVAGNSGSPIFYMPPGAAGVTFGTAIGRPVLIGVQSISLDAADIAGMTPVADLFGIIEQKTGLQNLDLYRGPLPKTEVSRRCS
jgi:hypothetical protein